MTDNCLHMQVIGSVTVVCCLDTEVMCLGSLSLSLSLRYLRWHQGNEHPQMDSRRRVDIVGCIFKLLMIKITINYDNWLFIWKKIEELLSSIIRMIDVIVEYCSILRLTQLIVHFLLLSGHLLTFNLLVGK